MIISNIMNINFTYGITSCIIIYLIQESVMVFTDHHFFYAGGKSNGYSSSRR